MGEVEEPYEGGTGSLLEVRRHDVRRNGKAGRHRQKTGVLIEQERIAGAVFPADLSEERKTGRR